VTWEHVLAVDEPTAVAGVRDYQLQAQLHVGAPFGIEVLVGRTVAQHEEFRVNSGPNAFSGFIDKFGYPGAHRWHLH
jgi:hypothetical protein